LLAAGEAHPGFQFEIDRYLPGRLIVGVAIPAYAYLVFTVVTGRRPLVLVEVGGIEVKAVDPVFRVFPVRAADLP
jgi:hypothetical protein